MQRTLHRPLDGEVCHCEKLWISACKVFVSAVVRVLHDCKAVRDGLRAHRGEHAHRRACCESAVEPAMRAVTGFGKGLLAAALKSLTSAIVGAPDVFLPPPGKAVKLVQKRSMMSSTPIVASTGASEVVKLGAYREPIH